MSAPPSPMAAPVAVPVLVFRLHVLQHMGLAQDLVWQAPEQAGTSSFADILGALPGAGGLRQLSQAQRASLQHCTIKRTGEPDHPIWVLGNGSSEVACSVNHRVLSVGSTTRLKHGDEVELGLTRLRVSITPADAPSAAVTAAVTATTTATLTATLTAAISAAGTTVGTSATIAPVATTALAPTPLPAQPEHFELTDLDVGAADTALPHDERYGPARTDFGDLISFTPQESAAMPRPHALAQGQVQSYEPAPLSLAQALEMSTAPDPSHPPSDLLTHFDAKTASADHPGHASADAAPLADDPLDLLHAQYLHKLRHPSYCEEGGSWQVSKRDVQTTLEDPIEQWKSHAGDTLGLDDLLRQSTSIHSVIRALDPLGSSDLMEEPLFDSVMHLFAPEDLRADSHKGLQALVQPSLPGITRREHHSLSVDSAMPFIGGEDAPTQTSTQASPQASTQAPKPPKPPKP